MDKVISKEELKGKQKKKKKQESKAYTDTNNKFDLSSLEEDIQIKQKLQMNIKNM